MVDNIPASVQPYCAVNKGVDNATGKPVLITTDSCLKSHNDIGDSPVRSFDGGDTWEQTSFSGNKPQPGQQCTTESGRIYYPFGDATTDGSVTAFKSATEQYDGNNDFIIQDKPGSLITCNDGNGHTSHALKGKEAFSDNMIGATRAQVEPESHIDAGIRTPISEDANWTNLDPKQPSPLPANTWFQDSTAEDFKGQGGYQY